MKLFGLLLFLLVTMGCAADSEFGRTAIVEEALEREEALRELIITLDTSMSMSMSMSMSFTYDSQDDSDDDVSNEDDLADSDSNGSNSTVAPTPNASTSAPDSGTVNSTANTNSPTTELTVSPLSCYGMEYVIFESPLYVETSRDEISYSVLENQLEDAMRDILPFCEDLNQRKLTRAPSETSFYIGNVDLVGDESGVDTALFHTVTATCRAEMLGNNCFVAALTLKLFGNATEGDIEYILEVIEGLLETDMDGTLGVENGLEDINEDSTASDGDKDNDANSITDTQEMTAGRKAMISLLSVAVVAMLGVFAYRRFSQPRDEDDSNCEGSQDSLPHTMAVTDQRERLYVAP